MFSRHDIRYHAVWVRVVCCLAVAIGIANAVRAGMLAPVEELFRSLLVGTDAEYFGQLSTLSENVLMFVLCLIPAIPRIERPITMIAFGAGILCVYVVAVFAFLIGIETILPIASPMAGLLAASAVLETMAWSEERSRRRSLEDLEAVRQQFADMLVHDLRKRMSSILMSLAVFQRQNRVKGQSEEVLTTIRASADREMMFLPFVSGPDTRYAEATDAMGLGLTFCRLAVAAHGGSIDIESPWQPHADGVCVLVRLPASA